MAVQGLYAGHWDMWATGSFSSPDPVTAGDTSWTWDVEIPPASIYAKTSINSYLEGNGYAFSGIVEYRTRNSDGSDTVHDVGVNGSNVANGVVDLIWDNNVDSVTFGFGIAAGGGDFDIVLANVNAEAWIME